MGEPEERTNTVGNNPGEEGESAQYVNLIHEMGKYNTNYGVARCN